MACAEGMQWGMKKAYCGLGAGIVQLPGTHRADAAVAKISDCPVCAYLNWRCIPRAYMSECRKEQDTRNKGRRRTGC